MCVELATGYNFSSFVALHVIYKLFCMLLIRSSWTSATLSLKTEEYQSWIAVTLFVHLYSQWVCIIQ